MTLDLIVLTISQGYGDNLKDISRHVAEFLAEKRGAAVAEVVSAIELDEDTQKSIKKVLKKKFGRNVELKMQIDEDVLGGAKTHTAISGTADYMEENDISALDRIKAIIDSINFSPNRAYMPKEARQL